MEIQTRNPTAVSVINGEPVSLPIDDLPEGLLMRPSDDAVKRNLIVVGYYTDGITTTLKVKNDSSIVQTIPPGYIICYAHSAPPYKKPRQRAKPEQTSIETAA